MCRLLWWTLFIVSGIWLQALIPGMDFLAAGMIICLQEERWLPAALLFLSFILIQEGTGSLAFGTSLLWYGGAGVAFFLGRKLLDPTNPAFYVLFSVFLAAWTWSSLAIMADSQSVIVPVSTMAWRSLIFGLLFPAHWFMAHRLYRRAFPATAHV